MRWKERGALAGTAPQHRGFGQTVIVDMVKHALDAEVSLSFRDSGVLWEIEAPAEGVCVPAGPLGGES